MRAGALTYSGWGGRHIKSAWPQKSKTCNPEDACFSVTLLSISLFHSYDFSQIVLLLRSLLPILFLSLSHALFLYFCHSVFKVLFSNTHSFYMFKYWSMVSSSHRSLHPWSAALPQYHLSGQVIWLWDRAGLLGLWKWQGGSLHHSLFSLNLKREINPTKTEITGSMALTSNTRTACVWLEEA